jgi:sugar (pentulose or hexulose) kinase
LRRAPATDGPLVIGIDVGTSVVKAVVFDDRGRVVDIARRDNDFAIPRPGWAECDMESVWGTVAATVREIVHRVPRARERIRAAGVCGNMGGAWLADDRGEPVRPAILWNDGRAAEILARWRRHGHLKTVFTASCNMPVPGFSLSVLAWLEEHEPHSLKAADTLFFSKDWIRFRLTGERCTEETDASHLPGDVWTRGYSMRLLEVLGLAPLERLLLPLVPSGDIAGTVHARAAEETGLAEGTPVVTGLADVSATLTGADALDIGRASAIVGTSCLNSVTTHRPEFEPSDVGFSFLVPGGRWTRTLSNQTGTIALSWMARTFMRSSSSGPIDFREIEAEARSAPLGARGLVFHPYLNSTGVSAPLYEPRARGRLWGLGLEHGRADLLRAVYEGVALSMADCFEFLPRFEGPVILVGGGSRSDFWRQMFADVTGHPMVLLEQEELGSLGVAMMAGAATGVWRDLDDARAACTTERYCVEPDAESHDAYRTILRRYQRLRRDLVEEHEDHAEREEIETWPNG